MIKKSDLVTQGVIIYRSIYGAIEDLKAYPAFPADTRLSDIQHQLARAEHMLCTLLTNEGAGKQMAEWRKQIQRLRK